MQICGLVLEFDPQRQPPPATLQTLCSWPHVSIGKMQSHQLPLVLETKDPRDNQYWHDRIAALNGIQQVRVAYVAFDNDDRSEHQQETCHVA